MRQFSSFVAALLLTCCSLSLIACGGGSGSGVGDLVPAQNGGDVGLTPTATLSGQVSFWEPAADLVPNQAVVKYRQGTVFPLSADSGRKALPLGNGAVLLTRPAFVGLMALSAAPANTLAWIEELRRDPNVVYAEPNYLARTHALDPMRIKQWYLPMTGLAQDVFLERPVVVAVIDSGINVHDDHSAVSGFDFVEEDSLDGDGLDADPADPEGVSGFSHGGAVAGIIGATTGNGLGMAAVAPGAELLVVRVAANGSGTTAAMAEAIRYAAGLPNASGHLPERPAEIINISMGSPSAPRHLREAVEAAADAGVWIVASSGNDGNSVPQYPSAWPQVLAVGATRTDGSRASYSSFGPHLDLVAPCGENSTYSSSSAGKVLSLGYTQAYSFTVGTSFAAPQVSGALAQMRAINPSLTLNDIQALLRGDHPDFPDPITFGGFAYDEFLGHGILNVPQARRAAAALAALPPTSPDEEAEPEPAILPLYFGPTATRELLEVPFPDPALASHSPWLVPVQETLADRSQFWLHIDRSGLAPGIHQGEVVLVSKADPSLSQTFTVLAEIVAELPVVDRSTVWLQVAAGGDVRTLQLSQATGYRFELQGLESGAVRLQAGTALGAAGLDCRQGQWCSAPIELLLEEATRIENLSLVLVPN